MPTIVKEAIKDHFGGEISSDALYAHLDPSDARNLKEIILPTISEGVRAAGSSAGVIAIGSASDLGSATYIDIDLIVCAQDAPNDARTQRIEIFKAFLRSNTHIIHSVQLSDHTVWDMWVEVLGNTPRPEMYYEIVLPDSKYSWDFQLAHDRGLNLSFSQLLRPGE